MTTQTVDDLRTSGDATLEANDGALPKTPVGHAPSEAIGAAPSPWPSPSRRPRPPHGGRRARKVLVETLVYFVLIQAGAAAWLLSQGPYWEDPIFRARLHKLLERRRQHPDRPIVVVLGSSRLLNGLDEDLAIRESEGDGLPVIVANFACPGGGPRKQQFCLDRLVRAGLRPDLIVVEALPSLLFLETIDHDLDAARLPTRQLASADVPLVEKYTRATRPGVTADYWGQWSCPLYSYRFALMRKVARPLLSLSVLKELSPGAYDFSSIQRAYGALDPEQRQKALEHARCEHFPFVQGFRQDEPGCKALFDLLAQCRSHDLKTVVVVMPEGPVFQSWYSPESRREWKAFMQRLACVGNTPVLDARHWLPNEDYFADSHHLLTSGGTIFTTRLWRESVRPLLDQQTGRVAQAAPHP